MALIYFILGNIFIDLAKKDIIRKLLFKHANVNNNRVYNNLLIKKRIKKNLIDVIFNYLILSNILLNTSTNFIIKYILKLYLFNS